MAQNHFEDAVGVCPAPCPKHSLGDRELHQRVHANPNVPVDPPDRVADMILDAAINEPEEQYMDSRQPD